MPPYNIQQPSSPNSLDLAPLYLHNVHCDDLFSTDLIMFVLYGFRASQLSVKPIYSYSNQICHCTKSMKIFATHYNTSSSVNFVCSDKVLLLQKDYLLCFKKSRDIRTDTYQTICLMFPSLTRNSELCQIISCIYFLFYIHKMAFWQV